MSTIRKFDVSTVVEVTDPATDEERQQDDEDIDPLVRLMVVSAAKVVFDMWLRGEREYISIHINEVP